MPNLTDHVEARLKQPLAFDENLIRKGIDLGSSLAVNLAVAMLIIAVTVWAAGWASKLVRNALSRVHRRNPDPTLATFGASLVRYLIVFVGGIAMLQQLGVQTTSILAVLGAASLAVGLALQGTLSNVAAGVMLLLFRTYRVGDTIETASRKGVVRSLDLFVTELTLGDNTRVTVPNSKVFGDVILNYTTPRRRVDAVFKVPFKTDIQALMAALKARALSDPRVRKEPAPAVEITSMSEVFVEGVVKAWTSREEEGAVKSDLLLAAHILGADPGAALPPLTPPVAKAKPAERRAARRHRLGLHLHGGRDRRPPRQPS